MASDTEGIAALFSMYSDDEEEEDADAPPPPSRAPPPSPRTGGKSSNPKSNPNPSPPLVLSFRGFVPLSAPPPGGRAAGRSTPPPPPRRRGALAIVDYTHDEMAMSPEQEAELDGDIRNGIGGMGSDAQVAEGSLEERTLSGLVHILSPNIRSEMSQHSDAPEQNQVGADVAMDVVGTETEDAQVEEAADVSTNVQNGDPLNRFLPPPVTAKCSAALQQKINKFLSYKRAGKSFNAEVRNKKDYKNPDFLQHAVNQLKDN